MILTIILMNFILILSLLMFQLIRSIKIVKRMNRELSTTVTKGIIFDCDGTLTMPGAIDFNAMYSRCNFNRKDGDILSQINKLSNEDDKRRAHEIIIEEEIKGMERMQLREHLNLLFNTLNYYNIKVAISTRNNEEALSYFLEKSKLDRNQFSHLLHRDSIKIEGKSINKPDARVALHVLEDWNLENESVWFVGDSDDDINCGISAGMNTCLIRTNYNSHLESEVTVAVDDLIDFAKHLKIL